MKSCAVEQNLETKCDVDSMTSPKALSINGCTVKGNILSQSSSRDNRQSSSDRTNGNCQGLDENRRNNTIGGLISGNYLQNKMSFSSITNVNQELFYIDSSSERIPYQDKKKKHVRFETKEKLLNGMNPKMDQDDVSSHPQQYRACDQNFNNHSSSVLNSGRPNFASSSSLKSFGSHIDSTLRGSEYLESVRQQQHRYQDKLNQNAPMEVQHGDKRLQQNFQIWYCVQFRRLCQLCLVMPLIGLLGCLCIACLFQFGDIQETACKVYNLVPSISAITGISPGRYLWRVCIAFHLGPRLLIVATYYHFLLSFVPSLSIKGSAHKLTSLLNYCFYLQIVEILSLCTISFIHNREHYPIHQKGFIFYILSSHVSFLLILKIYHVIWPFLSDLQKCSYRNKLSLFILSLTCMSLMAYYYYRHFIHCDPFAFSIFAFAEYVVAVANMGYYWTIVEDLPTEQIVVMRPGTFPSSAELPQATNENTDGQLKDTASLRPNPNENLDEVPANQNPLNDKDILQNGYESSLRQRVGNSCLPSDPHETMLEECSPQQQQNINKNMANGCISNAASLPREQGHSSDDRMKQE